MVKTLWILSSRCRPRVDVEMSTLQVSDSGLGEGDEGGAGPGPLLGVGDLQCRPRVDEGEANLLQVVDPGILLLEVGKGLLVDTFRLLASLDVDLDNPIFRLLQLAGTRQDFGSKTLGSYRHGG